jgi:hypothetical protein
MELSRARRVGSRYVGIEVRRRRHLEVRGPGGRRPAPAAAAVACGLRLHRCRHQQHDGRKDGAVSHEIVPGGEEFASVCK